MRYLLSLYLMAFAACFYQGTLHAAYACLNTAILNF
jgi:hypothetical protein